MQRRRWLENRTKKRERERERTSRSGEKRARWLREESGRRREKEREKENTVAGQQRALTQWALKTENKRHCSALFRIDICEYSIDACRECAARWFKAKIKNKGDTRRVSVDHRHRASPCRAFVTAPPADAVTAAAPKVASRYFPDSRPREPTTIVLVDRFVISNGRKPPPRGSLLPFRFVSFRSSCSVCRVHTPTTFPPPFRFG